MTGSKQPISVLVLIYTTPAESSGQAQDMQVLLLERTDHPGYWQSVTGSCEAGETLAETARREVREETGLEIELNATRYKLTDWKTQNSYEIYPQWRHRYPAGVTRNTEHVFGLELPQPVPIQLAPREHLKFQWLAWQDAAEKVFSPSNRAAILELAAKFDVSGCAQRKLND